MTIKLKSCLLILVSILQFSSSGIAHERFMLPTHTILSGDKNQYITVSSSISNDIFHPDRPLADNGQGIKNSNLKSLFKILKSYQIKPDGTVDKKNPWQAFQRMSVADFKIDQNGTHRIELVQPETPMTTFKKKDGTPWRLFGKKPNLPEGAYDVVRRSSSSRVNTFVTLNKANTVALHSFGKGLELSGETHPNDLFANEKATFRILFNGKKPTEKLVVKVIKGGTRHRNSRDEQALEVNQSGEFSFTPNEAGFYFLSANLAQKVEQPADIDVRHYALYLTLEVMPE